MSRLLIFVACTLSLVCGTLAACSDAIKVVHIAAAPEYQCSVKSFEELSAFPYDGCSAVVVLSMNTTIPCDLGMLESLHLVTRTAFADSVFVHVPCTDVVLPRITFIHGSAFIGQHQPSIFHFPRDAFFVALENRFDSVELAPLDPDTMAATIKHNRFRNANAPVDMNSGVYAT